MITLYHGSNVEINEIDLGKCKPGKDFGKGFYLNPNYSQAYGMAVRTTRILKCGSEIVSTFEFDDSVLDNSTLKVKIFPDYSEEWAEFVLKNRKNNNDTPLHDYDIVIGPIADDSVGSQIRRFIQGYLPITQLVEELKFHGDRAVQYYFGTQQSLKLIRRK